MTVQPTHVTLWGRGPDGGLTVVADGTASWCIVDGVLKAGYSIRYRDVQHALEPLMDENGHPILDRAGKPKMRRVFPTYTTEKGTQEPTGSFWSRKEGRSRSLTHLKSGDPRHSWTVPVEHFDITADTEDVRSKVRAIIWAHWIERMQKKIHATKARRTVVVTKREAMIDFSAPNADIIATLL